MNRHRRILAGLGPLGLMFGCSAPAPTAHRSTTTSATPQADGPDATVAAREATTSTGPTESTAAGPSLPAAVGPTTTVTVTVPATVAPVATTTTFTVLEREDESYSDIEWLIRQTFPETPDKAVRVARCESGLDPEAVSPGGSNVGLMQINVVHKGLVASMGYSWGQMLQAGPNLAVARAVYDRAGGWGPWSCA